LRVCGMAVPRIRGVDFSSEHHSSDLCTKIPPSFETPTPLENQRTFLLDSYIEHGQDIHLKGVE
jgi:hypothetical protein